MILSGSSWSFLGVFQGSRGVGFGSLPLHLVFSFSIAGSYGLSAEFLHLAGKVAPAWTFSPCGYHTIILFWGYFQLPGQFSHVIARAR